MLSALKLVLFVETRWRVPKQTLRNYVMMVLIVLKLILNLLESEIEKGLKRDDTVMNQFYKALLSELTAL